MIDLIDAIHQLNTGIAEFMPNEELMLTEGECVILLRGLQAYQKAEEEGRLFIAKYPMGTKAWGIQCKTPWELAPEATSYGWKVNDHESNTKTMGINCDGRIVYFLLHKWAEPREDDFLNPYRRGRWYKEEDIFATREAAQAECDRRNKENK